MVESTESNRENMALSRISGVRSVKFEPVGRWYEAHCLRRQHKQTLSTQTLESSSSSEDVDVAKEEEDDAFLSNLDPSAWKDQDHYAVLGLKYLRSEATPDQIKRAYKRKVLKHHPDKRRSRGIIVKDVTDDYFTCITRAYEILGNATKRRSYDSVDSEFDNTIPSKDEVTAEGFYATFASVFKRNSKWSIKKNVPKLGDESSSYDDVCDFYSFWYEFESWREYSYLDEEEKEKGENREERRWIEKQNRAARQKLKKEEILRIRQLVDAAYAMDPRIQRFKDDEKQKKMAIKLALVQKDDSIKIFSSHTEIVPLLKYKLQKNVSQVLWQPFSSSVLAVACQTAVLIWTIEPMSLATRPSASAVRILQVKGHSPITDLSWNPTGSLLLSASPNDTAIIVWDVSMETYTPLRRVGGGGTAQVTWSPDGSKVFSAATSKLFRVWETNSWSCEKWSNLSSHCQAACWSPDGSVLLFATSNEPIIFSLTFTPNSHSSTVGGSATAVKCADLSETVLQTEDGESIKVGGNVLSMVWDEKGERLAVTFQGEEGSACNVVALFRTKLRPLLEISPCGCVVGQYNETAEHVSFKPQYNDGALLCVVWSSSRVAYVPLHFLSPHVVHSHQSSILSQFTGPINIHSLSMHTHSE